MFGTLRSLMFRVVTISSFMAWAIAAFAQSYTYAAGLGNLPQDQSWTYRTGGSPPAPTNVGGFLYTSATSDAQLSYWEVTPPTIDFNGGSEIAARVQMMDSSSYSNGVFDRAGWNLIISDSAGRFILAGISNNSVHLRNVEGTMVTSKVIDAVSEFHDYRLAVENFSASLYIDGLLALTAPVSGTGSYAPNTASFGDSSILAKSDAKVHWVHVFATVPEPSTLAIFGLGGLFLLRRIRRK